MQKLSITGGRPLKGKLRISGAKNAALPILAGALLASEPVVVINAPQLQDVKTMIDLLASLGAQVVVEKSGNVAVNAAGLTHFHAPYELVKTMRASFLVLGPLVAKYGEATVSLPGGCAIGSRPVDQHLKGLTTLGAQVTVTEGYVKASAPQGLTGAEVHMDVVTVGGTENLMMAACLAKGRTRLHNCAQEPEITDLGNFLNKLGAQVSGHGTPTIDIDGVEQLRGCRHWVMADRVEAGTYLVAAAATRGREDGVDQATT